MEKSGTEIYISRIGIDKTDRIAMSTISK